MATIPSNAHQKTRCATGVSSLPPAVIVSITSDPESDDVTKKITTSTMPMNEVTPASGNSSSIRNRASSGCPSSTAAAAAVWPPSRWSDSAVAPKACIQSAEISTGTASMPPTRPRTVRPREIRAMNMPTKGVHESHQAQKKVVHPCRTSTSSRPTQLPSGPIAER